MTGLPTIFRTVWKPFPPFPPKTTFGGVEAVFQWRVWRVVRSICLSPKREASSRVGINRDNPNSAIYAPPFCEDRAGQ